ncbi:MAG: serine protease [Vicinamibacterales bacterium]
MTLRRYAHRFGGSGTIVTLADGRACTAAHCIAAADGLRGTLIASGHAVWRVERRWSPARRDLALLVAETPRPRRSRIVWAPRALLRRGVRVAIAAWTGRRFAWRAAIVREVTRDGFVADLEGRAGVRPGDSGGAVIVGSTLVGVVTHRTGRAVSAEAAASVRGARVDTPDVRLALARLRRRAS